MPKGLSWIRGLLDDHGHNQKELANAWGVTDAVVSRFINSGQPELTVDRAVILGKMIGMDMNTLILRVKEGLAPSRTAASKLEAAKHTLAVAAPPAKTADAAATLRAPYMVELDEAVKRARAQLPKGWRVCVSILNDDGNLEEFVQ